MLKKNMPYKNEQNYWRVRLPRVLREQLENYLKLNPKKTKIDTLEEAVNSYLAKVDKSK